MTQFQPEIPNNTQLLSEFIDGDSRIPKTEERQHIRIPTRIHKVISSIGASEGKAMKSVATNALYFGRQQIGRTYDIDWDAWRDWSSQRLNAQSEKYTNLYAEPVPVKFEAQGQLNKHVYVVPKSRHFDWWSRLRDFTGVQDFDAIYRLAINLALVWYDWETHAGQKWTRWLAGARQCVWEFEQVVQDRQTRIQANE